jgi:hypothetical protein
MVELCGRATNAGGKCQSPALRGQSLCYYHDPSRQARPPLQGRPKSKPRTALSLKRLYAKAICVEITCERAP